MKAITEVQKKLKQIAAFLGLVQGLVWMLLSIICIILYYEEKGYPSVDSYMSQVRALMYSLYLSSGGFSGQIIVAEIFIGFMWAYLVLDLIWIVVSISILHNKKKKIRNWLRFWSLVTALICLLDLVLVILLGVDYHLCVDSVSGYDFSTRMKIEGNCSNGILTVMAIAAKGFVLWVINVIFVVILLKVAKRLKQQEQQTGPSYFQSNFVPSPHLQPQTPLHIQTQPQYLGNRQFYQYPPTPSVSTSPLRSDYPRMQGLLQSSQHQQPFVLAPPPPPRNRY